MKKEERGNTVIHPAPKIFEIITLNREGTDHINL